MYSVDFSVFSSEPNEIRRAPWRGAKTFEERVPLTGEKVGGGAARRGSERPRRRRDEGQGREEKTI